MVYVKRQLLKQMRVLATQGPFDLIFFFVSGSFREIFNEDDLFCLAVSTSDHFPSPCKLLVFFWTDTAPSLKSSASMYSARIDGAALIFWCHQRIISSQAEMLSVVITGWVEYINLSVSPCIKGLLNSLHKISVCHCNTWRNSGGERFSKNQVQACLCWTEIIENIKQTDFSFPLPSAQP